MTPKEFILKTNNSEKAYTWKTLKSLDKSILISKEGITVVSENFRESRTWQNFSKVMENKQIFLLFHSRNRETVIVPKRIFDDEKTLNAFRDYISIIPN